MKNILFVLILICFFASPALCKISLTGGEVYTDDFIRAKGIIKNETPHFVTVKLLCKFANKNSKQDFYDYFAGHNQEIKPGETLRFNDILPLSGSLQGSIEIKEVYFRNIEDTGSFEIYTPWLLEKLAKLADNLNEYGKWEISESQSLIDDSPLITCSLSANEVISVNLKKSRPTLFLRYKEGRLEAYVAYGAFISTQDKEVTVRFDKNKAESFLASVSSDFEAVFFKDSMEFITKLAKSNRLVLRITPYGESPITTSFNLNGIKSSLRCLTRTSQQGL